METTTMRKDVIRVDIVFSAFLLAGCDASGPSDHEKQVKSARTHLSWSSE